MLKFYFAPTRYPLPSQVRYTRGVSLAEGRCGHTTNNTGSTKVGPIFSQGDRILHIPMTYNQRPKQQKAPNYFLLFRFIIQCSNSVYIFILYIPSKQNHNLA